MGVLNVTPDSFSDGGEFFDPGRAAARATEMAAEGADIIDIGGESTRPGAREIDEAEEIRRVVPVIKKIVGLARVPISIDTRKPAVAEAAVKAGASIINDISALTGGGDLARIAAQSGSALVLMHMRGSPADMQDKPYYADIIKEISGFLKRAIGRAIKAGVRADSVIVDPGIGFGKTVEHNLTILNRLGEFKKLGAPICVGTSRKSFIGRISGEARPTERLAGTLASSAIAILNGASILRVHDVKQAVQASRIADSIKEERVV